MAMPKHQLHVRNCMASEILCSEHDVSKRAVETTANILDALVLYILRTCAKKNICGSTELSLKLVKQRGFSWFAHAHHVGERDIVDDPDDKILDFSVKKRKRKRTSSDDEDESDSDDDDDEDEDQDGSEEEDDEDDDAKKIQQHSKKKQMRSTPDIVIFG